MGALPHDYFAKTQFPQAKSSAKFVRSCAILCDCFSSSLIRTGINWTGATWGIAQETRLKNAFSVAMDYGSGNMPFGRSLIAIQFANKFTILITWNRLVAPS